MGNGGITLVDATNHAAAHIIPQHAFLAFGVGLFDELTKAVVDIAPVTFVGVAHTGFAAQLVVDQGGAVTGGQGPQAKLKQ